MATTGQLRARHLPIVEVMVTAISSSTKSSKPLSLLLFSSCHLSLSPIQRSDQPPPPLGYLRAQNRFDATHSGQSAEPVRLAEWPRRPTVHVARPPPASQETVNMTNPYAPSLAEQALVVVPGWCTIAWWRLQGDL